MTEKEDKEKKQQELIQRNKERIQQLELELKEVNEQLITSKRLITKFREAKESKSGTLTQNSSQSNLALLEQNSKLKKRVEEMEE